MPSQSGQVRSSNIYSTQMPIRSGRNSAAVTSSGSRPSNSRSMDSTSNSNAIRDAVPSNLAKTSNGLIVPLNDMREFKTGMLSNLMKYTVISDPSADEAAIALRVGVGSFSDPNDWQGMAHAVEHDVFISSAKYPEVDLLNNLAGRWGGSTNAYTSDQATVYEFELTDQSRGVDLFQGRPKLQHALDVFSSLFIAPTFNPDYVDKERNAVHDEFSLKEFDAFRRCRAVLHKVINQNHPGAHFATGNTRSLANGPGRDLRTEVSNFFNENYSSARMHIAVVGPQSINRLEHWVQDTMSQVQLLEGMEPDYSRVPIFPANMQSQFVQVKSPDNNRYLTLWFQTSDPERFNKSNPNWIISSILQDQRQGSLYSILADKNWIKKISMRTDSNDGRRALTGIQLELRKEGFRKYKDVTKTVFAYLHYMRRHLDMPYVHEKYAEGRKMKATAWLYGGKWGSLDTALAIVENSVGYDYSDLLYGNTRLDHDLNETLNILDNMKPDKTIAILSAPRLVTNRTEEWYNIGYKVNSMPADDIAMYRNARLISNVQLPGLNPLIPASIRNYSDSADLNELPRCTHRGNGFEVWSMPKYFLDSIKTHFRIDLSKPGMFNSAKDEACMAIFRRLIREKISKYETLAEGAQQRFTVKGKANGLEIVMDGKGFTQKQLLLLERIFQTINAIRPDYAQIELHIEELQEIIENSISKGIDAIMHQEQDGVLKPGSIINDESLHQALSQVNVSDVTQFINRFQTDTQVIGFIHGNIIDEHVDDFARLLSDYVNLPRGSLVEPENTVCLLDEQTVRSINSEFYFSKNNRINGYLHTYQSHGQSMHEYAAYEIMAQMMDRLFFSEARTENQVGYSLGVEAARIGTFTGLTFRANSSNKSVPEIHEICTRFLLGFISRLDSMTDNEFTDFKEGVMSQLRFGGKSAEDVADMNWSLILREKNHGQTDFFNRLKAAVRYMTIDDIKRVFEDQLLSDPRSLLTFMDKDNRNWIPDEFVKI